MRVDLFSPLTSDEIQSACRAVCTLPSEKYFHAICTDSREVQKGDLFIALAGEHVDGSSFCQEVHKKGGFCLSDKDIATDFLVENAQEALSTIAQTYKQKFLHLKKTVAITGSVGKTTTKEMVKVLLRGHGRVFATPGNLNSEIGISLSVLSAPIDTEYLVLELGINHPGEMEKLSLLASPDIAIITNIGSAHIGNFASYDYLVQEKQKITSGLPEKGVLLLSDTVPVPSKNVLCKTVSLRQSQSEYTMLEQNGTTVYMASGSVFLSFSCLFNEEAAKSCLSLAIAAVIECGIFPERLQENLSALSTDILRMRRKKTTKITVWDDSYNASFESMMSSLLTFVKGTNEENRCVLLGDMLELGHQTEQYHKQVGKSLHGLGIQKAFFFGVYAPFYKAGALEGGMSPDTVFINNDITKPEITEEIIQRECNEPSSLLCKASHAVGLERIIETLCQRKE